MQVIGADYFDSGGEERSLAVIPPENNSLKVECISCLCTAANSKTNAMFKRFKAIVCVRENCRALF